jgi:hypothetical protein
MNQAEVENVLASGAAEALPAERQELLVECLLNFLERSGRFATSGQDREMLFAAIGRTKHAYDFADRYFKFTVPPLEEGIEVWLAKMVSADRDTVYPFFNLFKSREAKKVIAGRLNQERAIHAVYENTADPEVRAILVAKLPSGSLGVHELFSNCLNHLRSHPASQFDDVALAQKISASRAADILTHESGAIIRAMTKGVIEVLVSRVECPVKRANFGFLHLCDTASEGQQCAWAAGVQSEYDATAMLYAHGKNMAGKARDILLSRVANTTDRNNFLALGYIADPTMQLVQVSSLTSREATDILLGASGDRSHTKALTSEALIALLQKAHRPSSDMAKNERLQFMDIVRTMLNDRTITDSRLRELLLTYALEFFRVCEIVSFFPSDTGHSFIEAFAERLSKKMIHSDVYNTERRIAESEIVRLLLSDAVPSIHARAVLAGVLRDKNNIEILRRSGKFADGDGS